MVKTPQVSVAIVGISGYAGLELARLILRHPFADLIAGFSTQKEFRLSRELTSTAAAQVSHYPIDSLFQVVRSGYLVFLATPAEVSAQLAPKLLEQGCDVIDLSGAFRLSPDAAVKWYGLSREAAAVISQAQYGLVPWVGPPHSSREEGSGLGRLVANPGCYPTCVLMAILPLLKGGWIDPESLVIDAKSGTTGAGKKAAQNLLFSEVEGECLPYRVGRHQHYPEICEVAQKFSQKKIEPYFTTQLLNIRRGMIASIYSKTVGDLSLQQIQSIYDQAYSEYPLAQVFPIDGENSPGISLKRVVGTGRVEMAYHLSGRKLTVFSWIDNLMKGASSQAVENMNRLFDFPLCAGLIELEGIL